MRAEWRALVRQRQGRQRAKWTAGSLATAAAVTLIFQTQPWLSGDGVANGSAPLKSVTASAVAERAASVTSDMPAEDATPRFGRARTASRRKDATSGLSGPSDDRVPDEGLPRRILVNYSWETR